MKLEINEGVGHTPNGNIYKNVPGVPKCKEHMKLKQMWVGGSYPPPPLKSKNNWVPSQDIMQHW